MNKNTAILAVYFFLAVIFITPAAHCKMSQSVSQQSTFDAVFNAVSSSDGVKKITYDQFMKILNSGEKFILVDVLSSEDYKTGHIAGAISMPIGSLRESYAKNRITAGSRVIVYCNGFECHASSEAARKLSGYGYKALDYKGGLQEWQARGGKLVR